MVLKQMGLLPTSYNPYAQLMPMAGSPNGPSPTALAMLNDFLERAYELQER